MSLLFLQKKSSILRHLHVLSLQMCGIGNNFFLFGGCNRAINLQKKDGKRLFVFVFD
jgi:hypothetical protein